ncbi:hypothetical protein ACJZ2D_002496 [Fusarium nematophilum]
MFLNIEKARLPWIWHPDWVDSKPGQAGGFVHFRKHFILCEVPTSPIAIDITADTRYKLYVNGRFVSWGPVRGDERRWFYDTVDIQPYLCQGDNHIAVHVLRFFHVTTYAVSFARMPIAGLYIRAASSNGESYVPINGDESWETAIDPSAQLRTDEPFDDFLQTFERVDRQKDVDIVWKPAKLIRAREGDWGMPLPWKLCPRMIPHQTHDRVQASAVHNVRSDMPRDSWRTLLCGNLSADSVLPHGTHHHVEIEFEHHLTALLALRFAARSSTGSTIRVTYSETYEDDPFIIPYGRSKNVRTDTTKKIIGPFDEYVLGGQLASKFGYSALESTDELFQPFHLRTFRFLALDIDVAPDADLTFKGVDVFKTTYPLNQVARFHTGDDWVAKLWEISVRTLENCMHDNYEDCPFFEQMQYPMDTRSSCLFTYLVSGDDRLARQAILQLYDSFDQSFLGVGDTILESFSSRIDPGLGLIRSYEKVLWEYTDWTRRWVPAGTPPAVERTGVSTYINCLYAYTLQQASWLLGQLGRNDTAKEYTRRADDINTYLRSHCYDGEFFTDGLCEGVRYDEYSQHSQVFAVLCGAAPSDQAGHMLDECIRRGDPYSQARYDVKIPPRDEHDTSRSFTKTSISFSFYTIRALSVAGGDTYDRHFHDFWQLWKDQIPLNVTTWPEDSVCIRSDCHAWGSVPIYEFAAEVAGIQPAEPGWAMIGFSPRLKLFPKLEACVPVRVGGKVVSLEVRWGPSAAGTTIELRLGDGQDDIPGPALVLVTLPGKEPQVIELVDRVVLEVTL